MNGVSCSPRGAGGGSARPRVRGLGLPDAVQGDAPGAPPQAAAFARNLLLGRAELPIAPTNKHPVWSLRRCLVMSVLVRVQLRCLLRWGKFLLCSLLS